MDWLGTVAGIVSALVACLGLYRLKRNREIVWDVSVVQGTIHKEPPFSPFPDQQVAILLIANGGRNAILAEDFETSLMLVPLCGGKASKCIVLPGHEKFVESICVDPRGTLSVRPRTLNKGDAFAIVVLNSYVIQGHECMSLDGHVREIDMIESYRDRMLRRYKFNGAIGVLCAFAVFFIISVGVLWYVAALLVATLYWFLMSLFSTNCVQDNWCKQWSLWFQDEPGRRHFEESVRLSSDDVATR